MVALLDHALEPGGVDGEEPELQERQSRYVALDDVLEPAEELGPRQGIALDGRGLDQRVDLVVAVAGAVGPGVPVPSQPDQYSRTTPICGSGKAAL